jgi:membrane protein implicated in regulation of membrane protease activity
VVDKSDDGHSHQDRPEITTRGIFTASTLLAFIISVPALAVTVLTYYILKMTLTLTLIASLITLFLAMGFGYKLSKKLEKTQLKDKNHGKL